MKPLLTTTGTLEGWEITEYLGPVSAQVVIGTGLFTEIASAFTDLFGATSEAYRKKLDQINEGALRQISDRAASLGATVVLGLRVDHDEISAGGKTLLMVTASGTAAIARRASPAIESESVFGFREVRDQVARARILREIHADAFRWDPDRIQELVELQLFGAADGVLAHARSIRAQTHTSPWSAVLFEFFSSFPREVVIPYLYGRLRDVPDLRIVTRQAIRLIGGFDASQILEGLGSGVDEYARELVDAAQAEQLRYTADDIEKIERVIARIGERFPEIPRRETGGGLLSKPKVVRKCPCGREVESPLCPSCERDEWGFPMDIASPRTVIPLLADRVAALRALSNGSTAGEAVP